MRAFLSSQEARHRAEWVNRGAYPADSAVYEARAILAETEPAQGNGTSGHYRAGRANRQWNHSRLAHDEAGHLSGTAWVAHEAIKEALAAFVALPDCVICGAPFDHGCNTAACSETCAEAGQ